MLVTEHWDARCLNNGLFYVRASYRTLTFFTLFLKQIYINPYTDNQNLFDAFLSHSTLDAAVPDARPVLRYVLLDVDQLFGCAEGHANQAASGEQGLLTFHFWASDFRTREAAESADGPDASRIIARNGVERVEKVRANKDELFDMFFSEAAQKEYATHGKSHGIPRAGANFIAQALVKSSPPVPSPIQFQWRSQSVLFSLVLPAFIGVTQVKAPKPNWRGMCSVTAVGVEDLVDERLLQGQQQLIDWQAATHVVTEGGSLEETIGTTRDASAWNPVGSSAANGDNVSALKGIALEEWIDALQALGELSEMLSKRPEVQLALEVHQTGSEPRASALGARQARFARLSVVQSLKHRLRSLDVGTLLTVRAFRQYGPERLLKELEEVMGLKEVNSDGAPG